MTQEAAARAAEAASVVPTTIPPLIHAIAGSLGGAAALLLFYPLERARIEMQKTMSDHHHHQQQHHSRVQQTSSKNISKEVEAVVESPTAQANPTTTSTLSECIRRLWERKELYRGVTPIVVTLAVSNFVFFYVNQIMKDLIFHKQSGPSNSYRSLLASCLAGICNVLLTNPLWVANLRIVTGDATSSKLFSEMIHIARKNGIGHLWSGTAASLLLVSNPVLQFFCYEELKLLLLRGTAQHTTATNTLPPVQAFVSGALAKAVSTVLTYPLQLAQTVMRMQQHEDEDDDDDYDYNGTWDCLFKVYCREGGCALFTGMRAKLLQSVLTAAFTFLTYEQIATALHTAHQSFLANNIRQQQRRRKLLVL